MERVCPHSVSSLPFVVGLRRVGWAWAPARAMDKAGFTAWLGEDLGGTTLSDNTKRALVAGFDEGVITSSNVRSRHRGVYGWSHTLWF